MNHNGCENIAECFLKSRIIFFNNILTGAKMHLIKTKRPGAAGASATGTGRGAAAASESPTPSCFQSAVNIAKQKNRETGPGQIFSPADVASVRHSLSCDSLPRSRLAEGTASLDCRGLRNPSLRAPAATSDKPQRRQRR